MGMLIRRGWDWPGNECWLVLEETPSYYAPSWTKVYRARIDYGPVGTKVDLGEIVASGLKMIKSVASDRARRHGFVPRSDWAPFEETVMNPMQNPRRSRKPFRKVYIPVTCQTPGCPWQGHPFNVITYEGPSSGLDPFYESFGHGGGEAADFCPACKKLGLVGDPRSRKPKRNPVQNPWQPASIHEMAYKGYIIRVLPMRRTNDYVWFASYMDIDEDLATGRSMTRLEGLRAAKREVDANIKRQAKRNPVQNPPSCPQCGGEGDYLGNLGAWEWFRCIQCGWEFSPTSKAKRKVLRRRRGGFSEASHYLTERNPGPDPSQIKRGDRFFWFPGNKVVMCTQTDKDTGCGPVFSDPDTGHDVLRVSREEFKLFASYFRPMNIQGR